MLGLGAITADTAVNVLLKATDDTFCGVSLVFSKSTLKCGNAILGVYVTKVANIVITLINVSMIRGYCAKTLGLKS